MTEQKCGVCGQGGYWVGYDSEASEDRCINHVTGSMTPVASESDQ